MLANETEFPQQGSRGYLVGTGQEARIIQCRGDGRLLVSISEKLVRTVSTPFKRIPASSRTIHPHEIKATLEEACPIRPARTLGEPISARTAQDRRATSVRRKAERPPAGASQRSGGSGTENARAAARAEAE